MGKMYKFSQYLREDRGYFPFYIGSVTLNKEDFHNHVHDFSEMVIITGGEGLHTTDFGVYPLRAGDVYLIHPPYSHGFRECRHLAMYNISYESSYTENLDLGGLPGYQALFKLEPLYRKQHNFTSLLHLNPEQRSSVVKECLILERELLKRKPGYRTVFEGKFRSLAGELCRYYEDNNRLRADRPEQDDREDLLKLGQALAVLEQRYTEDLSVEELAALSGYSVNHFSRLCNRVYGLPPRQYIVQQRLSLAARLLGETDLSITETADSCGYADPNYFSRLFKRKMGVTPREYRIR
jgi:AraC family L-rhamnose operon transcriptional activator RhaR